jgi:hypothetical protein
MTNTEVDAGATRHVAVHPSTMIPGIPSFLFDVPDGWITDEAPNALCVVRQPHDINGFWANVIVRHDKVPREVDFERAAKTTWRKLQQAVPSAVERGERLVRFGSNVVYVRGADLDGDDGQPLAQIQAMFFAPVSEGGKIVDFFQIIGTCLRDDALQSNMEQITAMIASFRFL